MNGIKEINNKNNKNEHINKFIKYNISSLIYSCVMKYIGK